MIVRIEKYKIGVGIEGRSVYPVRLELGLSRLSSSFCIKEKDAHKLIDFLEEHPISALAIESTRGSLEVQFVDKETLVIENMDHSMLMAFPKDIFEELHRLLTLTVPKLQEFIEKNWDALAKKKTDDNLRSMFG